MESSRCSANQIGHSRYSSVWLSGLTIVLLFAALAVVAVYAQFPLVIRVPLGALLVLLLPGYALTAALFPLQRSLTTLERLSLAIGLSIAITIQIALLLEFLPFRLGRNSITFGLAAITIGFVIVGALRRHREVRIDESPEDTSGQTTIHVSLDRTTVIAGGLAIASILLFGGAGVLLILDRLEPEPTTEFAVFTPDHSVEKFERELTANTPSNVLLEIVNHEGALTDYRIEVLINGALDSTITSIRVPDEGTWQGLAEYLLTEVADEVIVSFNLYRTSPVSDVNPYRSLQLIVSSSDPASILEPIEFSESTAQQGRYRTTVSSPSLTLAAAPILHDRV